MAKILSVDVEYNSQTGSVYQIGAAKYGNLGEIEIFDAITPVMLHDCCEMKGKKRFADTSSNILVGSFPIILQAFLDFAKDSDFILSWGCIDGIILARESERLCLDLEKEVFSTYFDRFVNLQGIYMKRMAKGGNHLIDALRVYGIEFFGSPHVASFDAYNTLLMAKKMIKNDKAYLSTLYGNILWGQICLPYSEWLYSEDLVSVSCFCS